MFGTNLHFVDLLVIAAYLATTVAIGLWFTRRASKSTTGYFLAGRSLPWWIAGTSIVATTFSADTPLQVVGWVRTGGINENWLWWSMATGHIIAAFIFAPLWQRSGLTTDVEFIQVRYHGTPAKFLRAFSAVYGGLFVNSCVIAAVCVAMSSIIAIICNIESDAVVSIGPMEMKLSFVIVTTIALVTIAYSTLSGLYGVVYTDLFQFVFSMIGAIGLAFIVVGHFGGVAPMMEQVRSSPAFNERLIAFFPEWSWEGAAIFTFFIYFGVNWWSRAPGHGALAQRLLACRSQRDSILAMLWFNIAHYCLRPWPWIVVGVASLAIFPSLENAEAAYPMMINQFLPVGLKGIMVVAMLSAFMSTVDTHVNLASAYLANDLYRPLIKKERSERHFVLVGRLMMLPLLMMLIMIAAGITQIVTIYKFLYVIMSGTALVMILRWLWWRVNAWSEISAMATTILATVIIARVESLQSPSTGMDIYFGHRVAITLAATTIIWLIVTWLTPPTPQTKLEAFYRRVQPPGPGWRPLAVACPDVRVGRLRMEALRIILATAAIYSGIVGTGKLVLGQYKDGWLAVAVLVPCIIALGFSLRSLPARGEATLSAPN